MKLKLTVDILQTAVPEPANRVWKEVLSASYSSSTSGNWSWDASDQSVPSTPSPPLSNDTNKNFLLSSQGDDVSEDVTESTHFMFEDPIPRKRKVKVDFHVLLQYFMFDLICCIRFFLNIWINILCTWFIKQSLLKKSCPEQLEVFYCEISAEVTQHSIGADQKKTYFYCLDYI